MTNSKLTNYAVKEGQSKGRIYHENYDDSKYRSVFGRDRDRIICSSAFRRLQYKTQVFVNHQGDHYRTRLTHSLEVAQIARWIAGGLNLNKDLAEIISLAHDLGHPPFGHAGEDEMNKKMKEFGGFSHNSHTLKLLTKLETRFIEFEGLNLSFEVLDGVIKHNGAIRDSSKLHEYIKNYSEKHNFILENSPSLEAQISSIADDIAYNNHDLEDGLRAGLFEVEDVFDLPIIGEIYKKILSDHPKIKRELLVGEAKKRIVLAMVVDVIENAQKNISENKIQNLEDVFKCEKTLICFSRELENTHQTIKKFLMEKMYRHYLVNKMTANATKIISDLFDFYIANPHCLPLDADRIDKKISDKKLLAIFICDYIAGMTDRYAIKEHEQL